MKNLKTAVETYLDAIKQIDSPELGGTTKAEKGREELRRQLLREQKFNRIILLVIVMLLASLYLVGIYLVLKNQQKPLTAGALLGGDFASLLLVIQWIRQVLLDKVYTDMLVRASDELDPEHFARFTATWYEIATNANPDKRQGKKKKPMQSALAHKRNG